MLLILLFAFAAGLVTILAPCILPVLPIVLSGGAVQGKARPWGIILGVVLSFSVFTLALSWAVQQLGLSPNFARNFGIAVLAGLGILFLIPNALDKFEGWMSAKLSHSGQSSRPGFAGGFILGISLGAVWTPCAGPILASVVAAAQTGQVDGRLTAVTIAYAIGAALPMGLIAALGQRILDRVRWLNRRLNRVQQIFGVLLIGLALLMLTGSDRNFQSWLIQRTPNWLPNLQKFEDQVDLHTASQTATENSSSLKDLGVAPELTGITGWINSQPTSLADLRGQVVLIKFWTYSCINCIRTLPYVQSWYDTYHDQGFTILAVHTPEFEFEKVPANVEKAVKDFQITYPVALDPNYGTWTAYQNHYWPAEYLIDARGHIRYTHFGEGEYDTTEKAIQQLLREAGHAVSRDVLASAQVPYVAGQTPETYFGSDRAERFVPGNGLVTGQLHEYTPNANLALHAWTLQGAWTVQPEYSQAEPRASLDLHIQAQQVYVVMSAVKATVPLNVTIDGQSGAQYAISAASIDEPTIYQIANFGSPGEHQVTLSFPNGGARVYAATFGSGASPGLACSQDGKCTVVPLQ